MRIHRLELLCSALLAFGLSTAHAQAPAEAPAAGGAAAEAPAEPAHIGQPAEPAPAEPALIEPEPVEGQPVEGGGEAQPPREVGGVCASDDLIAASFEQQSMALEGVTELVSAAAAASRADLSGLAANLTVRANINSDNILSARSAIQEVGGDVRGGFVAQSAALLELNAKADLLVGSDDSAGLSDIYDAARKAASGGDVCANNCTGRGVCQFGRCFASAEGIDDLDGTVQATRAELQAGMARVGDDLSGVEAALATQGALVELNQGGLDAVQVDVGQIRETLIRSQAKATLRADDADVDLTVGLDVAAQVVSAASDEHAALEALVGDQRGRGDARAAIRVEAALAAAAAQLEAGNALKAVIAARTAHKLGDRRRAKHLRTWERILSAE
jgi:uncharacterized protein (UPF0212 family)